MARLSVVSVADRAGFYTFAAALRSSDYYDALEGAGPFTVFAPTDAAFSAMSPVVLDSFLHRDRVKLQKVLGYHFAPGRGPRRALPANALGPQCEWVVRS